jgi:hypothetical protein
MLWRKFKSGQLLNQPAEFSTGDAARASPNLQTENLTPIVRPSPAPNNLATAADDGLRHSRKPELGPDRGCDVRDKLCAIGGDVEHLAFETFDAARIRFTTNGSAFGAVSGSVDVAAGTVTWIRRCAGFVKTSLSKKTK